MLNANPARHYPIGAELCRDPFGVDFIVWAPIRRGVEVIPEGFNNLSQSLLPDPVRLLPCGDGYFRGFLEGATAGLLYRFRLDGQDQLFPDPASRFQPLGPHGPSMIVDPFGFQWRDSGWKGLSMRGQVIYELHVGTFTPEGTWQSAVGELPRLHDLGITTIEIMPIADFPGRFGWGYDGVNLFAPYREYGLPDDFRAFIDGAHALGMGVVLDVVYNHLGPGGNYLGQFSNYYFTKKYKTDWGDAINFDGEHSAPVREYFITNAQYWIEEYHLDGLRLDATQNIYDTSGRHILAEISAAVRRAAGSRSIVLIAENESQDSSLLKPIGKGGYGLDAVWNDDFHHSARVRLTGRNEAYYSDYLGSAQEFVSAMKHGYLFQGQWYRWQDKRRGLAVHNAAPESFVNCIENHDQVANSASAVRCHLLASPGEFRAMTALFLLGSGTPMLFQGQEFGSRAPFYFFADHEEKLARLVFAGRKKFLSQFESIGTGEMSDRIPDPSAYGTFERCKLEEVTTRTSGPMVELHRDLLKLKREDPVFSNQRRGSLDGAVFSEDAFVLRFFGENGDDRLMLVNFGRDLRLSPAPEPLLAPPEERDWSLLWSSEDPRYGGHGIPVSPGDGTWFLPGHSTVVFASTFTQHYGDWI